MAKKGRKDAYSEKIQPFLNSIMDLCKTMTDRQIAEYLGVSYSTFNKYKKEKTELSETIKRGRKNLVSELKSTLIKKAIGYKYEEVKITTEETKYPQDLFERLLEAGFTSVELSRAHTVKTEVKRKEAMPDVAAINLLLKNYDKEEWANDPQLISIRKRELEIKEKLAEQNIW